MTPQESQALQQFLQQLVAAQAGPKDAEADQQIQLASARQPEALYLLVQRALIQDQALAQAQAQIASLQAEVQRLQEQNKTSFLNSGWGNSSRVSAGHSSLSQGFQAGQVNAGFQGWQASTPTAGAGSWLGTMAATAAGVAAGAFLFQGLGNLMGGSHAASQSASQLNNGSQSDLLPGYFDQNAAAETAPALDASPATTSAGFDSASLSESSGFDQDFSADDDFDLA